MISAIFLLKIQMLQDVVRTGKQNYLFEKGCR